MLKKLITCVDIQYIVKDQCKVNKGVSELLDLYRFR